MENHDDDELEEELADVVGAEGNRDNSVFTTCRVNPKGFCCGSMFVDSENNEIGVVCDKAKHGNKVESWVLDDSLDSIPMGEAQNSRDFASQDDVWAKVKSIFDNRLVLNLSNFSISCIGGHGSGKTFTLFGNMDKSDLWGIVPRYVDYAFSDTCPFQLSHLKLQMFLVLDEQFIDLLDPDFQAHDHKSNIYYSENFGPMVMPMRSLVCKNSEECLIHIQLGLKLSGVVLSNFTNFMSSAQMLVVTTGISNKFNRINRVSFAEIGSMFTPVPAPVSVDRFAGLSLRYISSRSLYESVKLKSKLLSAAKKQTEAKAVEIHEKSVLTFLLQDCLYKHPHCLIIGCLRGNKSFFEENFACLDFMNRLDMLMEKGQTLGKRRVPCSLSDVLKRLEKEVSITKKQAEAEYELEQRSARRAARAEKRRQLILSLQAEYGGTIPTLAAEEGSGDDERGNNEEPNNEHNLCLSSFFFRKASHLKKFLDGLQILHTGKKSAVKRFVSENNACTNLERLTIENNSTINSDFETVDSASRLDKQISLWLESRGVTEVGKKKLGMTKKEQEEEAEAEDPLAALQRAARQAHATVSSPSSKSESTRMTVEEREEKFGEPYFIPVYANGASADQLARIPLRRGNTWIRGTHLDLLTPVAAPNPSLSDMELLGPSSALSDIRTKANEEMLRASTGQSSRDGNPEDAIEVPETDEMKEERMFYKRMAEYVQRARASAGDDNGSDDGGTVYTATMFNEDIASNRQCLRQMANTFVVRVNGPGLVPLHCHYYQSSGSVVSVTPHIGGMGANGVLIYASVAVNGNVVTVPTQLSDGDVVTLGCSRFYKLVIPRQRTEMEALSSNGESSINTIPSNGSGGDDDVTISPLDLTLWEAALLKCYRLKLVQALRDCEAARKHTVHMRVDRELTAIAHVREKTPLMKLDTFDFPMEYAMRMLSRVDFIDQARLCESIGAANFASSLANELRRGVKVGFRFKQIAPNDRSKRGRTVLMQAPMYGPAKMPLQSLQLQSLNATDAKSLHPSLESRVALSLSAGDVEENLGGVRLEERAYGGSIICEVLGGEGTWLWTPPVFKDRLYHMHSMRATFLNNCNSNSVLLDKMYTPLQDPFADTLQDELIGVGFLYLDGLQFLLDINHRVPLVSYAGYDAGSVQLRVRAWIDKVEVLPAYITADRESHLSEFLGQKCILRFYFEGLQQIPKDLSASTYIYFKFFYHSRAYKTPRHAGISVNPFYDHDIMIEQKITADFIEYLKSGCIEMEVFGKRRIPFNTGGGAECHRVGEPESRVFVDSDGDVINREEQEAGLVAAAKVEAEIRGEEMTGKYDVVEDDILDDETQTTLVTGGNEETDMLIAEMQKQIDDSTQELSQAERELAKSKKLFAQSKAEKAALEQEIHRMKEEAKKALEESKQTTMAMEKQLMDAKLKIQKMERERDEEGKKRSKVCVIC